MHTRTPSSKRRLNGFFTKSKRKCRNFLRKAFDDNCVIFNRDDVLILSNLSRNLLGIKPSVNGVCNPGILIKAPKFVRCSQKIPRTKF